MLCRFAQIFAVASAGFFSATAAPIYFTRTWQVEQGLPQNKVTAVVQTRDGYLWIGTYNGLARFDGVRFTVFDDNNTPELRSSRITSLYEAGDSTLWIGTESGDVSQYKDGHFAAVPLRANWSAGKIYEITSDEAGDVWLINESGELARVRDGQVLTPSAGVISKVVALTRSASGQIWVDREGRVSLLKQGQLLPVGFAATTPETYPYIQGIAASRDGGLWVACDGSIKKWRDGQWVADLGAAPWGWRTLTQLMEAKNGTLVGGNSGYGICLVSPGQTNTAFLHFDQANGLPSDWVISLWEDREENLWCGTGAGLVVIRPNNLETISPPDKWKSCPVLCVLPAPDGALWIGTEGAGLYRLQNGAWTSFYSDQGIRNPYVWSLAADSAGRIWAGTWGGGLYARKGDSFDIAPGLENFRPPIPALLFLDDGLWIGTTAGALRYQNGKLEQFNEIAGKPFGDVRAITPDKSGAMWFGTAGGGLVRLQNGNFRRFKKSNGLSSDFIECLHFADDGTLWIGTFGGGLSRFKDGKFSVIQREQGLPNGVIGHIEADGRGFFWMSSYGGILRANERDLNRCADGELAEVSFLNYGINDGLPTLECSEGLQLAGGKTADGRLWFPTAKGLVAVDPAGVKMNPLPPPVCIEEMRVDDKKFADGNAAGPVKIPPGRHRIEFEYTGLSFVAPEKVRFKCRLKGFEPDWANVGGKRVATYNYIPPGNYSFQVAACNNDGVWNEAGAALKFEVLPYFWQTTWFRVLGGLATMLAAGGAVWFETRRQMRHRLERAERQRDIERERSRIAKDIHDDLGASLTRIAMLSQSNNGEMQLPESMTKNLDRIFATARELTRAMDEIVWAVNPRHDRLDSLAGYLNRFAYEYLSVAEIRCRLDLPLNLPTLPVTAEVRHNLFLAFKEALHNIVKHAGAKEVQAASVARTMQDYVKQLDPLRPVTYASPEDDVFRGINSVIEVRGWNYHYGPQMDRYHAAHPTQPNFGTEQASVVGTRGIYTNDHSRGYVAAYDLVWPTWTTTAESWWSFFATRPWLSGAFVWTGFDYRGEPTPYWWPCVNSHFGILDTCGFPKDAFYYYQSWWTTNTVLHLLPHWNWPGREGQEILVQAFSNCKQVELFLNGASLGQQAMKPNSKLSWQVKYAPGTLSAKGFDAAGNVIAETKVETTGDATQIQLTPDRKTINADGEDVSVFTVAAVDARGRIVPVAQNKVNFSIKGAGNIIGVGNGDPSCHQPDVYVPTAPSHNIPVNKWRWQLGQIPKSRDPVPEYANDFDDSAWKPVSGGGPTIETPDTAAIYRAHVKLTEEDLQGAGALICFSGCDDEGWYFANNHFVGESHDWQAQPIFDVKEFLRAGDNVITVGVYNGAAQGGLNPNVNVQIIGHASIPPWSRSLFNGLAQVIVQSTRDAGEVKLTATADGLAPATAAVQTQPCALRPSVR